MENLPKEGGYIMYANHQGKYDVLGVIVSHDKPITYVMDAKRSKLFIADQLTDLVKAQRLDKEDIKQAGTGYKRCIHGDQGGKEIYFIPGGRIRSQSQ